MLQMVMVNSTKLAKDRIDMVIGVQGRVMMDIVAVPGIQSDQEDIRVFQINQAVSGVNKVSG